MSAIDNTPKNLNNLQFNNFNFILKRAPNVKFFLQKVTIPGISITPTEQTTPFVTIPYSGEHIDYGTLDIEFILDEDLQNWKEIHDWIRALGKPTKYQEYKYLTEQTVTSGKGVVSDLEITLLTNQKNPNYSFIFRDAFPVSLSSIPLQITEADIQYITAFASFKFTYYDIERTT